MKTKYYQVKVVARNLKIGKERVFAVPVLMNKTLATVQEQVKLHLNDNEYLKSFEMID